MKQEFHLTVPRPPRPQEVSKVAFHLYFIHFHSLLILFNLGGVSSPESTRLRVRAWVSKETITCADIEHGASARLPIRLVPASLSAPKLEVCVHMLWYSRR